MGVRQLNGMSRLVAALGLVCGCMPANGSPEAFPQALVEYDAGSSDELAGLKEHIAHLHQVIACQQEVIEQAKEGGRFNSQNSTCHGPGAPSANSTQSISTFNIVLDQFLGISSSALTAAPPMGNIVVNVLLLYKGKADHVYKKDFLWPLLDLIANADNIAYFIHGRYAMGRKEGNEDITSQSVAGGFDIITMILQGGIMYWQWRKDPQRGDYQVIQ